MSVDSWITVVSAIVATGAAAFISWLLFRFQQLVDFRKLATEISELSRHFALKDNVDDVENLVTIRDKVSQMDDQFKKAVDAITEALDHQKEMLEKTIQTRLATHLTKARKEFEECVKNELQRNIPEPNKRKEIADELVEVFVEATRTLSDVDSGDGKDSRQVLASLRAKSPVHDVQRTLQELRGLLKLPALLSGPKSDFDEGTINGSTTPPTDA